ncbi:murein biosynthesis integral membrane protein MurJ [Arthrobacter sp. 35W]|uniref:murein biosynthesis integral membrane protein MurJ n=1 Tax=Arthrobacter sp. 35W TaxID=1132441 RepID=UPI0004184D73|nr:murein biosynthesis integral membrane protein MurJ [Arthrobacter sp. 35W]
MANQTDTRTPEEAPQDHSPQRAARSSAVMAVGTLASRILGFLKGIILGVAVGGTVVANIFESANQVPNIIYLMLAGGVFNVVLIPQIVKASKLPDRGADYISRLLTLALIALLVITALVTALAGPLTQLLTQGYSPGQMRIAIAFSLLLLPQIFFYGLYALLGQILNAHNSFAAYAWAPVVNNIVAIGGLLAFIAVSGTAKNADITVDSWTTGQTLLLAGTATLGIVIQSLVLIWPVKKLGLKLKPTFGFRGTGLGATGRIATWSMATMIVGNLSFLLIGKIATIATGAQPDGEITAANSIPGSYALSRASEVYIMPHSVIALSIATVMFTQMAHAAASHDTAGVRTAVSRALRSTGAATVFAAVALLVLAGPFGMLFSGGQEFAGRQVAITLAILAVGSPFLSINFILNRVFYAAENAKTPFVIQTIMVVFGVVTALLAALLPPSWIIYALALCYTVADIVAVVISHYFLKAKIGDYGGGQILKAHMRFLLAALVAGVAGDGLLWLMGGFTNGGFPWQSIENAAVTLAVVGAFMAVVYFVMLKLLRVQELNELLNPILGRLRGRAPGR